MSFEVPIASDKLRVWIYRSTVKLSPEQQKDILETGQKFVHSWQSHGQQLKAEFQILNDHYLVFFVDQAWAQNSGCSIDASVGFIRKLDAAYHLNLLDRQKIGFLVNNEVVFHDFSSLKDLYDQGVITDQTLTFNQLVDNGEDFQNKWLQPFSKSPYFAAVR